MLDPGNPHGEEARSPTGLPLEADGAKVTFTVENRPKMLVVPTNSLVDLGGKRGVRASGTWQFPFRSVDESNLTEVTSGIAENEKS